MYLAEDRILCFEIVTKKREGWVYVLFVFRLEITSAAYERKNLKSPLVHFVATVRYDADDDLLPSFGSPHLRPVAATQVGDILDDATYARITYQNASEKVETRSDSRVHRPTEQHFVLVVHGHHDEQLRVATIQIRTQEVLGTHEIIRVARRSGVAHLVHLLRGVAFGDNMRRDLDVQDEVTILKLDMAYRTALHELLPRRRISTATGSTLLSHGRGIARILCGGWVVGLGGAIGKHGDGRRIVDVDLAHLVSLRVGVEMSLGAVVTGLVGGAIPVGIVFGLVGLLMLLRRGPCTVPAGGGVYLTDTRAGLGVCGLRIVGIVGSVVVRHGIEANGIGTG